MSSKTKPRGLGKGLDALLGGDAEEESAAREQRIPISAISPNPYQPRRVFREEDLESLTASIRRDGVLTPVLLRPHGTDGYQLVAGERRWRAAKAAGLETIPAVIREVDDAQALELAIIENEQRNDLTLIESAHAYQRLIDEFGYTQRKVAEHLGLSRSHVSNTLRLLRLPHPIQRMLEKGELDMGHARPLIGMDAEAAVRLAQECQRRGWSARTMEQQAKRTLRSHEHDTRPLADARIEALEKELEHRLKLPVRIRRRPSGGGELCIRYTNDSEWEALLNHLRGQA